MISINIDAYYRQMQDINDIKEKLGNKCTGAVAKHV